MRKAKIDMLNGSVMRPLITFCIPLVLTGWLQMLFSMADSFIAGKWAGAAALAAVGATFPFVMIIISLFGGLSTGVMVCASNDCGAGDMEADGDLFEITCDPDDFNAVSSGMEAKGYKFVSAQIEMVPQNYAKVTGDDNLKLMEKLLDSMEDDDDVQNVWHNWDRD